MINLQTTKKLSGICVPVSALKSRNSLSWGVFTDLILLGQWVQKCGLHIIQILPIQDTGNDPSPYMLCSSVALNPIYMDMAQVLKEEQLDAPYQPFKGSSYQEVRTYKLQFLQNLYKKASSVDSAAFKTWIAQHNWVRPYAVFCVLKDQYQQTWSNWPVLQNPIKADIDAFLDAHHSDCLFHAWIQYHLDKQLTMAVQALNAMSIALKGDMPIMLSQDSVDVWYHRELFYLDRFAGAPPDFFNVEGQFWGFPCYRWNAHEKEDFAWWKTRLSAMEQYFSYVRLDHVVGFFHTWTIPAQYTSGLMGYYAPFVAITEQELVDIGFTAPLIARLSTPCIPQAQMDVCFLKVDSGYYPTFNYTKSPIYAALPQELRLALERLLEKKKTQADKLCEQHIHRILKVFTMHTKITFCAETLGAIPAVLPSILAQYGILSLQVARWSRYWDQPRQPWMAPEQYPALSVATLSVHDSSTLREWWEENDNDKTGFLNSLSLQQELAKEPFTIETSLAVIHAFIKAAQSKIVILAIQDYFSLCEQYREPDAETERINRPGTIQPANWQYRIKPNLEDLLTNKRFTFLIKTVNMEG